MSTTTSNMGLSVPESSDTDYPTSISDSLELLDDHDHSSGKGVQIPAGGLASNSVITAKINDLAVTTGKINDLAVTTGKINDLGVTTGKLADGAVTPAKKAALGQQISSSSGTFSTTNLTLTDVTNLSVSITTTGRPVFVGLVPDGDTSLAAFISTDAGATDTQVDSQFVIVRAATVIAVSKILLSGPSEASRAVTLPPSCLQTIDVVAAGTYTYKVQVAGGSGTPLTTVTRCKLIAFEL